MAKYSATQKKDLRAQAKEILQKAKQCGVEHSFLFTTTFQRYQEHIAHLEELQAAIESEGTLVTKEYVKGRGNIYVNPAMNAYNNTAKAADQTAQLLLRYLASAQMGGESADDQFDLF